MIDDLKVLDDISVPVMITQDARQFAKQFAGQQSSPQKAEQVYMNTLAVCTVNNYLRILGIPSDLTTSDSWNPTVRLVADVADLQITGKGRLECRAMTTIEPICHVPLEAQDERIGFIVVHIDEAQQEAALLGFTDRVQGTELALSQLRSLAELPAYLDGLGKENPLVVLNQWLDDFFEAGWQTAETLLGKTTMDLVWRFRDAHPLTKGVKLLDLGMEVGEQTVALLVAILSNDEQEMNIRVQVQPAAGKKYLPPHLKLALLSESDDVLREVQSRNLDNFIQLPDFSCSPGEAFGLRIELNDASITEHFALSTGQHGAIQQ